MTVLHIAAQGDQPISLIYFAKKRKIDINAVDNKGGTALHWAAFLGYEISVNVLTTWDLDLD